MLTKQSALLFKESTGHLFVFYALGPDDLECYAIIIKS